VTATAPNPQPSVAVCIPAHGAPEPLQRLLASLDDVDYPPGLVERIVCVDGPDHALENAARDAGATVVTLAVNSGSYAARNAAIDAVTPDAQVVLFTDVDCTVTAGWIRHHVEALRTADASGGGVRLTTSQPPRPAEWVDAGRHLRQQHFVEVLGFAATCNLAVRRGVLASMRFDATLRSGGDFDFGQRLRAAGFTLAYTPDALVEHPARTTARGVLRKVARVAQGAAVNQARGHQAALRRDPTRGSALTRAAREGAGGGLLWRAQVKGLDLACSLVYARHVPSVVVPAIRRRLPDRR
jgi:cellulose synthase/poly-beta-1,6-N-acetylglucosamine synthase-like glycosyltransferase